MGWYSTGPRLREADLDITDLMANYCKTPLLVICEVQASTGGGCDRHPAGWYLEPRCMHNRGYTCACVFRRSQRRWGCQQQHTTPQMRSGR